MKGTAFLYLGTLIIFLFLLISCGNNSNHSSPEGDPSAVTAESEKKEASASAQSAAANAEPVTETKSSNGDGKLSISDEIVDKLANHTAQSYCACLKDKVNDLEKCRKTSLQSEDNMKKFGTESYELWKKIFQEGISNCKK